MNPIIKFFHEFLHPHCTQCMKDALELKEEQRILNEQKHDDLICQSCESLKMQLSIVNQQNEKLLNKIITTDELKSSAIQEVKQNIIQTRHIPWTVKKQQLEQESREKLAALKSAATPDKVNESIKDLETELGLVENGTGTT